MCGLEIITNLYEFIYSDYSAWITKSFLVINDSLLNSKGVMPILFFQIFALVFLSMLHFLFAKCEEVTKNEWSTNSERDALRMKYDIN